ncbi:RNA polymerase sigma factor [Sorangium sp. So ce426]|uniref:RNA polymerase sigma factor n=1 Tax=Sorangium sp. So ce426 TaxID=3133312 RepID=UPI003F5CAF08
MHSIRTHVFAEGAAPPARHDRSVRSSASGAPRTAQRTAAQPGPRRNEVKPATSPSRAHAFQCLLQGETIRRVRRWLARLRVPERDRHDLSQDVFLAAVMSFGNYDPSRGPIGRWLNGLAVNLAARYHAKASRRHEVITDPVELSEAGESATALELLLTAERRRLLRSLVRELPFELRSVLVQRDLYEIPMRDIAETRDVPLSTAYKWRTRALHGAQEALARRLAAEEERTTKPRVHTRPGGKVKQREKEQPRETGPDCRQAAGQPRETGSG